MMLIYTKHETETQHNVNAEERILSSFQLMTCTLPIKKRESRQMTKT
jgi:hypothetical protein